MQDKLFECPNISDAFKSIYYHLYSNGEASRAERIVEDLTLVLLSKLAVERLDRVDELEEVIGGADPDQLIRLIAKEFPGASRETDSFNNSPDAIRHSLRALRDISLRDSPAHVIGDAFQAVMGPRIRGDRGQFFTPRTLVRAMVEVLQPKPGESIADPACGTGGFLAEAHSFRGVHAGGQLVGVDKDYDLYRLATAMLGIVAGPSGVAYNGNSLSQTTWTDLFGTDKEIFDVILTNPPFGAKIGISDSNTLKHYALGRVWERASSGWHMTERLAPSRDPQLLFLELCVRLLRVNGRLGIVLPEGVFGNKGISFVWQWLRRQGHITALMDCPRTTFQPGTDTKTNVLFFEKTGPNSNRGTHISVALHCGHDRRGRTHRADGRRHRDDFVPLGSSFNSANRSSRWHEVDLHGREYLVPRYYEKPPALTDFEQQMLARARFATIGKLVKTGVLSIRKGHEPGSDAYGTGDIPFVRTSDIANYEINTDPTKSVSEDVYQMFASAQALKSGDLLLVVDGRYRIGAAALVTERTRRCVVQSHLRILSVASHSNELDPYGLLFALSLESVRRRIRDLVFVQSTLGTIGSRLLELEIPLLGLPGPWRAKVEEFRELLVQRDELLGRLRDNSSETYEL
jgi:type I restriction enzyme M protein